MDKARAAAENASAGDRSNHGRNPISQLSTVRVHSMHERQMMRWPGCQGFPREGATVCGISYIIEDTSFLLLSSRSFALSLGPALSFSRHYSGSVSRLRVSMRRYSETWCPHRTSGKRELRYIMSADRRA